MSTKAQIKAINKFNKQNTVSVLVRLNKKTDADILQKLETVDSKLGYIKECIRKDLKGEYNDS